MSNPISTKVSPNKDIDKGERRSQEQPQQHVPLGPQANILALQDTAGNQGVSQLLQSGMGNRAFDGTAAPPIVQSVMKNGGGHPLDTSTRADMESRFNTDFRQVRVHSNASAAASARALTARAYTYENHVVFGEGRYVPHTKDGRQLLAHELTHVIQQRGGSYRSAESLEHEAERAEQGVFPVIRSSVSPRPIFQLSPERATKLIVVLRRNGRADFMVETDEGDRLSSSGTANDLSEGMYQIHYNATHGMMIIQTADGTELSPGERFRTAANAHRLNQLLIAATEPIPLEVRAGIPEIDEIPERIREVLFSETNMLPRRIRQRDYATILRIADKLNLLSDSELEAYRSRTVGATSDWATFEASIDRYIAEVHQRREALQERERTKLRLYGLDEVYRQYRRYKSMLSTSATTGSMALAVPGSGLGGTSIGMQPTLNRMREELTTNLRPYRFNSITEFEQSIREFETAFRNETVLIAKEILDRYEHVLYEQERRYQNPTEAAALYTQLNRTQALRHYEEAERQQTIAQNIRPDPELHRYLPGEWEMRREAQRRRDEARRQAEREVARVSGTHPLIINRDFDREALTRASQSEVRSLLLEYIRERRSDVQETRRNLAASPDMVFELDTLLQAAYREQDIRPGSIYHMIIEDHISDTQIERAIINVAIAVFAITAGLLSGGTGTVAVLGTATAFGIGAYQAIEEFRRYERTSAAHGAQLLSDDPSFAWVIVAIVGAGVDLAAAGAAARALRPAVQAFNVGEDAGNLVALERRLAELTQVEERIRRNVLRAAEVEAQTRAAWRSVFRPPAALRAVIVPGAEEFGRLVYAVYLSIKRGIVGFERFVLTREAVDLIGDVARLTPEELTNLKAAYTQAIADSQNILRHGQSLGMADNEIHAFMRLHNNRRGMTAEQVMQEMDAWRATRQSGVPFGFTTADQFAEFRATAQAELRRLLRRSDPNAEAFLQGSSVSGISYSRQVPFDVESDLDIAISSRSLFRRARTELGLSPQSGPRRIGPLSDEHVRALGLGRVRDRLNRVLTREGGEATVEASAHVEREINFLLFENERAVRQPIRGSTESTRTTVPLGRE
jgi:hypothetical protein